MTFPRSELVNLRPATAADIPRIIELDRACPTAGHWTESRYRQAIQTGVEQRFVLVVEASSPAATTQGREELGLFGFLVACHVAPEWELENIAVASVARRKGLGARLLDALIAYARQTDSESVFLEVRESNTTARTLYERAGFEQTGRRKAYYADPAEDAILYRLQIVPARPVSCLR